MPKIIVVAEEHKQNFKPLNYEFVEKKVLSAVAKAVHLFLLTRPPNWIVHIKHMRANHFKERERRLQTSLRELAKHGYFYWLVKRGLRQKVRQYAYIVYEKAAPLQIARAKAAELGWQLFKENKYPDFGQASKTTDLRFWGRPCRMSCTITLHVLHERYISN